MTTRGLVIGKFLPPHRGHKHLIDTAAAACDELIVLLLAMPGEPISRELRHAWLAEIHPNAIVRSRTDDLPIDYSDPAVYDMWDAAIRDSVPERIDRLFSSELYGYEVAKRLPAEHVMVDLGRSTVPISGTAVRAEPWSNWQYIEPPVRAYYARRVLLTGAESTGTTTLAEALAPHFGTLWVPEYGREYAAAKEARHEPWSTADFMHIAREQQRREDCAARDCDRLLFCDTDALATAIWHEHYLGSSSAEVLAIADERRYDLVVLTDNDIPWVQDGERNSEAVRDAMQQRFIAQLRTRGIDYLTASGSVEERVATVAHWIEDHWGLRPRLQRA